MHSVGNPKNKRVEGTVAGGDSAREAWSLLAGLVYPPPFLAIARELGLRPASFGALRTLDRPRTMSEIAAVLHCDNSNVTGIVDGLEEKGLATRRPSETDRRVKLIALTTEGRRVRTRLIRAIEKPPAWLAELSEVDRRTLRDVLRRAVDEAG
ncbi:MAG: transcriptional regulator, MarR family [Solirubrobacterales bacterium]|nr:transcriptional regulator, MarR family [Solirubrobacterales bacterium]